MSRKHPFCSFPPSSMWGAYRAVASTLDFVLRVPRVLRVLPVLSIRFYVCLWKSNNSCCISVQGVFCVPQVTNIMLLEAGTHVLRKPRVFLYLSPFFMPAPLFPDSHKHWLAKGGHLGSWGSAAALTHNAFIVFEVKQ